MSQRTRAERFWAKVEKTETCWLWTGAATCPGGYGRFWNGQRQVPAHRWAYELLVGPIPDGLQIDHLCVVPSCVNPAHLEPVTGLENCHRASLRQTHCVHGHEYTPENTLLYRENYRQCHVCKKIAAKAGRLRRKNRVV